MKAAILMFSLSTLGTGAFCLWPRSEQKAVSYYSQTGRDVAILALIREAKKTISVRTSSLDCVPIANALLQKQQGGVRVHVEMPTRGNKNSEIIINALAQAGGTFELTGSPVAAYEGTYLLCDDREWIYSAAPITYGLEGVPRSFVRGRQG